MYDLLIRNAQLLDGSGQPAFRSDIAVEQGPHRSHRRPF